METRLETATYLFLRDNHLIEVPLKHVLELVHPFLLVPRELHLDESRDGVEIGMCIE
jgi:hypothetical protein